MITQVSMHDTLRLAAADRSTAGRKSRFSRAQSPRQFEMCFELELKCLRIWRFISYYSAPSFSPSSAFLLSFAFSPSRFSVYSSRTEVEAQALTRGTAAEAVNQIQPFMYNRKLAFLHQKPNANCIHFSCSRFQAISLLRLDNILACEYQSSAFRQHQDVPIFLIIPGLESTCPVIHLMLWLSTYFFPPTVHLQTRDQIKRH